MYSVMLNTMVRWLTSTIDHGSLWITSSLWIGTSNVLGVDMTSLWYMYWMSVLLFPNPLLPDSFDSYGVLCEGFWSALFLGCDHLCDSISAPWYSASTAMVNPSWSSMVTCSVICSISLLPHRSHYIFGFCLDFYGVLVCNLHGSSTQYFLPWPFW